MAFSARPPDHHHGPASTLLPASAVSAPWVISVFGLAPCPTPLFFPLTLSFSLPPFPPPPTRDRCFRGDPALSFLTIPPAYVLLPFHRIPPNHNPAAPLSFLSLSLLSSTPTTSHILSQGALNSKTLYTSGPLVSVKRRGCCGDTCSVMMTTPTMALSSMETRLGAASCFLW